MIQTHNERQGMRDLMKEKVRVTRRVQDVDVTRE